MNRFKYSVLDFCKDLRGMMIVEFLIFFPAIFFTFFFFFVAWDAHRDTNLAQKATYAVADMISRERGVLRQTLMINYLKALGYSAEVPTAITAANMANAPVALRITSVLFDEADTVGGTDQVTLLFSLTTSSAQLPAHTNATLQAIKNRIPALQDGDNIVVVESRLRWTPFITAANAIDLVNDHGNAPSTSIWLAARNIETFTTVRPRFVPRLCAQIGLSTIGCEL